MVDIRPLNADDKESLYAFFITLQKAGDTTYFHPHAFDAMTVEKICSLRASDHYCAAFNDRNHIIAYGLLRGYDDGYAIPSLGLAIHPAYRRLGLARTMMDYLHDTAARQGSERIRLKVYKDNMAARRLYETMGYKFDGEVVENQLLGIKVL